MNWIISCLLVIHGFYDKKRLEDLYRNLNRYNEINISYGGPHSRRAVGDLLRDINQKTMQLYKMDKLMWIGLLHYNDKRAFELIWHDYHSNMSKMYILYLINVYNCLYRISITFWLNIVLLISFLDISIFVYGLLANIFWNALYLAIQPPPIKIGKLWMVGL